VGQSAKMTPLAPARLKSLTFSMAEAMTFSTSGEGPLKAPIAVIPYQPLVEHHAFPSTLFLNYHIPME
jgi:hypothetical protein